MPPQLPKSGRYVAERRAILLARVQRVSTFALFAVAVAVVANVWAFVDRLPEHLASLLLQGLLCGASVFMAKRPGMSRHAVTVALALSLGQITIEAWAIHLSGPDAAALSSVLVGIMLFTSLVFPWGGWAQALTSGYAAVWYLLLIDWGSIDSPSVANLLTASAAKPSTSASASTPSPVSASSCWTRATR